MKKKINKYMIAVAIIAVLATALLISVVFSGIIRKQINEDLKNACAIIMSVDMDSEADLEELDYGNFGVTWTDGEGNVLLDNNVIYSKDDNISQDAEIADAINEGTGQAVRKSQDSKDIYCYAEKLENGNILRVSATSDSIYTMFGEIVPFIAGMIIIMTVLCVVITRVLARKIITPIKKMADDISFKEQPEYEELIPVVNMLKEQHENILNNARVRQEFSANVSHELKTPLTIISGYAELIENKMVDEESVIRFAGEIHHHSDRLLSLINDIIKLSELDSESVEVVYDDVDLTETVNDCMGILRENALQHSVTIETDCDRDVIVKGSRSMLEELVTNLINNAISYNKPGGNVWVSVKKNDDERAELIVRDNGIGIPEEHQERIFERFYRVDKSRSKRSGGTGLGLAIVKHIAASHNATITLESEVGKGTTVKVIF